jgi:translation initiation factor IF-2
MDKEQANPDRIKQQLAENNVLPEEWGGDAILVPISAKTGMGIDKLLETILLVAEMGEFKANPDASAMGTILEARLDKGRGAVASLIVRNGSLKVGDTLVSGTCICKVKAMIDENNKSVKVATPSTPVSVLGFSEVPTAGESFTVVDEKLSKEIVEERKARIKAEMANTSSANTLEDLMAKTSEGNMKILNVLLKTDVGGSLEAIKQSIAKIENDEVKVNILHSGVGGISESDVILANASNAVILGFNTHTDSKAKTVAERLKVNIKNYKIIYELIEELELVMKGMKEPKYEKVEMGKAEVLMVLKLTGIGLVAGSIIRDGVIARNTHARVIRDGEVTVEDCELSSVKIVKDDVKEAGKGRECGIKLAFNEIKVGDIIECFALKRIED